jgi:hypothetical protein
MLDYSTLDTLLGDDKTKPHPDIHCDNATFGENYLLVTRTILCKDCGRDSSPSHHECYHRLFGKPAWVCECRNGGWKFYFAQDSGVGCKCHWCGNKLCDYYA